MVLVMTLSCVHIVPFESLQNLDSEVISVPDKPESVSQVPSSLGSVTQRRAPAVTENLLARYLVFSL